MPGNDHVEERGRAGGSIDRIGLMDRADPNDVQNAAQLVERPPQIQRAVAEVRAESNEDRVRHHHPPFALSMVLLFHVDLIRQLDGDKQSHGSYG